MRVKSLSRMPKRKVTVDDLLVSSDINDLITTLKNEAHELDGLLAIRVKTDGEPALYVAALTVEQQIYLLERAKKFLLDAEELVEE